MTIDSQGGGGEWLIRGNLTNAVHVRDSSLDTNKSYKMTINSQGGVGEWLIRGNLSKALHESERLKSRHKQELQDDYRQSGRRERVVNTRESY